MIHVYDYCGNTKRLVGRLAQKDRVVFFEYAPEFLNTGIQLSPFKLPLKAGLIRCEESVFDGLFGIFNDSLPDGWGRLLLDRKLRSLDINPSTVTALDRLRYVGHRGMGALVYEPEIQHTDAEFPHDQNWDRLADEILQFQTHEDLCFVDELLALNGSSAGARPKILVNLNHGEEWIIKFRASFDPKDMGPIEYAYHLMAKAAQLEVPDAQLFPSRTGPAYFGVKRFDRILEQRIHMHTLSGLLHIDHRTPSLDYQQIMKASLWLTHDKMECAKQYRASVFNVLAHNRDDHAKNFSFLMDHLGRWRISPAYDLSFSFGPSGEHCTMIMGEGKNPNLSHLLKLAEISGIDSHNALQIIDEVRSAVAKWPRFAEEAGVSITSRTLIHNTLLKFFRK